jgi:hypothetical protein
VELPYRQSQNRIKNLGDFRPASMKYYASSDAAGFFLSFMLRRQYLVPSGFRRAYIFSHTQAFSLGC